MTARIAVVLPALDEADAVGRVVAAFGAKGARVVVVDNGSKDATAARAQAAGAEVVVEPRRGYGAAVLAGLGHLEATPPDIVVFADCDGTCLAEEMAAVVRPIREGRADLVLGHRATLQPGALPWKNRVARTVGRSVFLLFYGLRIRDIPPYRAARWSTIRSLGLRHATYGLPVETIAKARLQKARIVEVPVSYPVRLAGKSKVGVDVVQVIRAALIMTLLPVRLRFGRRS